MRSARERAADLLADDRARSKRRKAALAGVIRAAQAVEAERVRGRDEVAAAEAELERVREAAGASGVAVAVEAGAVIAAALEEFTDEELARYSGVKVTRLRQWRRAARDAAGDGSDGSGDAVGSVPGDGVVGDAPVSADVEMGRVGRTPP